MEKVNSSKAIRKFMMAMSLFCGVLAVVCLVANEPQCMFGCALLMMGFDAAAKYLKVHDDRIATEPRGSLGTARVSECSEAELGLRIFAILLLVAGLVVIALWAWGL